MVNVDSIVYQQHLTPLTRTELIERLRQALKPKRFAHVLRVEQTAVDLAVANGVEIEPASIAGLVHDYAKQRPDQDFLEAIDAYQLPDVLRQYGNAIWHGVVGAEFVKRELGITNEDILNAVRHHTTGAAYMTLLEQVVYMADYLEPHRDFDGVVTARQVTQASLAKGVAYQTKHTLAYLIAAGQPVYPETLVTYNQWVPQYPDV